MFDVGYQKSASITRIRKLALFGFIPCLAGGVANAQQAPATPQASEAEALESIVITARRREESLQDTPVAVTALTAEALELIRDGALDGLSIGYRVLRSQPNPETGGRTLVDIDLWEVSLVTFPMLPSARAHSKVRSMFSLLLFTFADMPEMTKPGLLANLCSTWPPWRPARSSCGRRSST